MTIFKNNVWTRFRRAYAYRSDPKHLHALSDMYWEAALSVGALIAIGAIAYGTLQLLAVLNDAEDAAVVHGGGGVAGLNRAQLRKTLDEFHARQAQYESLRSEKTQIADPSK